MTYRFATEDRDYSDFAGGRVLYSLPGMPAFPVRLASEIFQRAAERLPKETGGLTIYDPTCGGAYHLTALGFLHGELIRAVIASDVDEEALALAERNLGLLSESGLAKREAEIRRMLAEYGKESHADALRSLETLGKLQQSQPEIRVQRFAADALNPEQVAAGLAGEKVDLIISDVPYGRLSGWQGETGQGYSAIHQMLDAVRGALKPHSVVAIAADKSQTITNPAYRRVGRFQVGKRRVVLLEPARTETA